MRDEWKVGKLVKVNKGDNAGAADCIYPFRVNFT